MGVEREELGIHARALNSTLIGMYKRNLLGFMRAHNSINLNFLRVRQFLCFTVRQVQRTKPLKTPVLVDEEPGPVV